MQIGWMQTRAEADSSCWGRALSKQSKMHAPAGNNGTMWKSVLSAIAQVARDAPQRAGQGLHCGVSAESLGT